MFWFSQAAELHSGSGAKTSCLLMSRESEDAVVPLVTELQNSARSLKRHLGSSMVRNRGRGVLCS